MLLAFAAEAIGAAEVPSLVGSEDGEGPGYNAPQIKSGQRLSCVAGETISMSTFRS